MSRYCPAFAKDPSPCPLSPARCQEEHVHHARWEDRGSYRVLCVQCGEVSRHDTRAEAEHVASGHSATRAAMGDHGHSARVPRKARAPRVPRKARAPLRAVEGGPAMSHAPTLPRPGDSIARPFDHNARRNGRWSLRCGCEVFAASQAPASLALVTGELGIMWCPTHAQAPAMLEASRETAVMYRVPVTVTVNRETGQVVRVVVEDEGVALDLDQPHDPGAAAIAEEAEWPEWEVGAL